MSGRHAPLSLDAHLNLPAPRTTQGQEAAIPAMRRATTFAAMIRDEGPDAIGEYLDNLRPDQHYALTVALAAMVPLDVPVSELLSWLNHPPSCRAPEPDNEAALFDLQPEGPP